MFRVCCVLSDAASIETRGLLTYRTRPKNGSTFCIIWYALIFFNRLTPNDPYMGRTAPLNSKRCILYIYSTNIGTGYFKYALYCPFYFFSSKCSLFHNVNLFGSCIIHILYIECAEIKKNNSGAKGLNKLQATLRERKMALMKLFAKTNLKARHRIGIILLVQIVT